MEEEVPVLCLNFNLFIWMLTFFLYINNIFFLLYQIIQFIVNTKNEIDLFFFGNCKLYLVVDFSF